ncbi:MAG: polyamine aminopropyltransferase, partial [Sinobacteraceae bacterium]|nr:polyamine aminopropyltransferase [Nevskiaceae bacterium]
QLVCAMVGAMRGAGFAHSHVLSFPQPVYPSGWWSATLACKGEQRLQLPAHLGDVVTRYYTPAVHQAAFAQPAFLAEALDQALPG